MAGGSETILAVEDDGLVWASVISQLQGLSYETIAAPDAASALAIIDGGTGATGRRMAPETWAGLCRSELEMAGRGAGTLGPAISQPSRRSE